jgi:hypothetical protein
MRIGEATCILAGKGQTGIKEELSDCSRWGDILFIESLELLPKFRKHGLGLAALQSIIDTFGSGCSIVVIEPHPIDYNEALKRRPGDALTVAMEPDKLPTDVKKGTKMLRAHWSKLGFKPIPKTKEQYWYLDMSAKQPKLPKAEKARFEKLLTKYSDD